ncbi:MAG: M56 family metallopeptidase [Oscillospiraceae bacterium]|nr:M56 family metallopeptidase [Oscillospiraceae bacterium]
MRLEELFLNLLNMSITAGYVAIAVILLRLLLRKAPRWISCALWALVGLRLILPFSFESVMSLIPSTATVTPDILYSAEPAISSGVPAVNSIINPTIAESLTPVVTSSASPMQIVMSIAGVVWLAGMLAMVLYSAVTYIRLRRKVDSAVLLRDNIYESDAISSPFVLGIVKPRIYLPFAVGEEDRGYVVSHEQAHIRRKDNWIKPFGFLLLTVYWFNPLIWVAYILLCRDIEVACDEAVIRDIGGDEKRAYSLALLGCAVKRRNIAMCPLAFGEVGIRERVKNVLNYKKPAFWIIIVAVVVCVVAGICLLSNPKEKADTSYENPNAEQLFACRTAYVGDNSAVGNIVGLLKFPDDVGYDHIELQTSAEPYGVDVYFSVTNEVKAAYNKSSPENIDVFRKDACIMFALIGNADEVAFRLDDGTESPVDLQFTREWAESVAGVDLWDESGSAEKLDALITRINEHVESAYASADEDISTGPFVGYIKAEDTKTFDVYTEENGTYIMSLPMSLFDDFPANHWDPGWMNVDVYCGRIDDFTWAVACTGPSAGTGNENVCTSSDGGKTWWVGERAAMYSGTVTGAGFASSEVGFMSYRYFVDQGPEISRTLDGGKTWTRMTVDIPDYLTGYKMTPLIPTFAGESGTYPIELYDNDGKTSMAYLATEDGGMTWQWKDSPLDEALSAAFLKDNKTSHIRGECVGEGHIILGSETLSGVTKVYTLTMYGEYGFEDGNFVKVSGTGIIPAVFTFTDSGDGLVCTEILYPEDGSAYAKSIKKMFPSEYQERALQPSDGDMQDLVSQERAYAASYLKEIGRDATIGDYGDFEHTLLTDVGVPVGVSNSIINNPLFSDYPIWIGNREKLENGVRYVYQVSYDKTATEIVFTKYEYDTNKIVECTRKNYITGQIIEKTSYPDKTE